MEADLLFVDVHVVILELLLFVLQQIQGLLVVFVGFFQFVLERQIQPFSETEIEWHFGDILHAGNVRFDAVEYFGIGEVAQSR